MTDSPPAINSTALYGRMFQCVLENLLQHNTEFCHAVHDNGDSSGE